jgi:hypothetical protein
MAAWFVKITLSRYIALLFEQLTCDKRILGALPSLSDQGFPDSPENNRNANKVSPAGKIRGNWRLEPH